MENDFDNQKKYDTPPKAPHRIRWPALIIWPTFAITIVIFALSIIPFERNESGKINIDESIINIVKIFNPNIQTVPPHVTPKDNTAVIKSAIDTFLLNIGEYPVTLNDLVTNSGLQGWCGPYLKPSQLNDQWGNPFIYIPNSKGSYKLISYGADGQPGGEGYNADIYND